MEKGFTLAEVLITLGIIGVVAALTLPSVVNDIKGKQYEAAMKKGYSVLSQALERMNEEQGFIANQENYPCDKFAPVYKKYLKVLKDCGQEDCEALGYDSETGKHDYHSEVYSTFNGGSIINYLFDEGQFMLADGMFVLIDNDGTRPITISIDVNGYQKGPNKWGHDLFSFQIMNDTGKLVPMGAENTKWSSSIYCSKDSTSGLNGVACAYKAFTDSNYFKNLP